MARWERRDEWILDVETGAEVSQISYDSDLDADDALVACHNRELSAVEAELNAALAVLGEARECIVQHIRTRGHWSLIQRINRVLKIAKIDAALGGQDD